jgi:predicted lipid-binding transport protein (Tim44 family)
MGSQEPNDFIANRNRKGDNHMCKRKIISLAAAAFVALLLSADWFDLAEARLRGGGRSFSPSRSFSRQTTAPRQPSATQATRPTRTSPFGGAFGRGLAGGLMGGFIGSLLFGGMAHGAGMGGFGGSGIGLLEILLLAGLAYFLFKKFARRNAAGTSPPPPPGGGPAAHMFTGGGARQPLPDAPPPDDPLVEGVKEIWRVDDSFDPEAFKETAQDIFFKAQAGWTRRDTTVLKDLVGDQLLQEYDRHFADMRRNGRINRLENIAVRKVDLVAAGVQGNEIFVTVRFTANLLDYTVDEATGGVVDGDRENPVKFREQWTFARPIGNPKWKLEGIDS